MTSSPISFVRLGRTALFTLAFAMLPVALAQSQPGARRTIWDGVYTSVQAELGRTEYGAKCGGCHRPDLSGYSGVLKGEKFMAHWAEDKIGSFYDVMKSTMPRNAPASLEDAAYLKILAFVLQENGFPAGAKEIQLEDLDKIQVENKAGPGPVPAGAFVDVAGCLVQDASKAWKLTRATDLVRTRNPQTFSPEELKSFDARSGQNDYGMLDPSYMKPETLKDQKVAVKALVIRTSEQVRLNVTALWGTGSKCSN